MVGTAATVAASVAAAHPLGFVVLRSSGHSGSRWLSELLATQNLTFLFEFAGQCPARYTSSLNISLHEVFARACACRFDAEMEEVGPHNVYNIYDNCPRGNLRKALAQSGKSMRQVKKELREQMGASFSGGYQWSCGGMDAVPGWLAKPDVAAALHLKGPGSAFHYERSGPASITLWPFLASRLQVTSYKL